MERYRFDIRLWIFGLLSPNKRHEQQVSWIYALMKPFEQLRDSFLDYESLKDYQMAINGQVGSLEKFLSDHLNVTVTIEDGQRKAKTWLFNAVENRTITYIYNDSEGQTPIHIYNKAEYGLDYHFIIQLPVSIENTVNLDQLRVMVRKYSAAGKRFSFEFV